MPKNIALSNFFKENIRIVSEIDKNKKNIGNKKR
jgi:hypothetical protein